MNNSFMLVRCVLKPKLQKMEVTGLSRRQNKEEMERGKMSVSEAGRRGGARGGPRVRELVREGKEHEQE
jgi:hypothetical protein